MADADRRHEVREAARGWLRAGRIDEATRARIEAAYPDDRHRLGPIFRVLVFGFTIVVLQATLGIVGLVVAEAGKGPASLFFLAIGVALAGLTELQLGAWRRRQGGTEAATALLAVILIAGASLVLFLDAARPSGDVAINTSLVVVAIVLASAGYRWGYAFFVASAAVAAYLLLGRFEFGRFLWAVAPLALAPLSLRAADSPLLAPAHRRSCQAIAASSLVFLYLALHVGSWDVRLVELLSESWRGGSSDRPFRGFFVLATALVPVGTIVWGVATHRRLLINLGLLGALASLVTVRFYVHVAPLWVVLTAGGAAAIGLVLVLRRFLDSGPGRERWGFTAEPLFNDPDARSVVEVAASVAAFSPSPRPSEPPGFRGGGGRSGGAGASGTF